MCLRRVKFGTTNSDNTQVSVATPRARSMARLFATYAVITAVPVVLLGLALAASYRARGQQRGVAEGGPRRCSWPRRRSSPSSTAAPCQPGLSADRGRRPAPPGDAGRGDHRRAAPAPAEPVGPRRLLRRRLGLQRQARGRGARRRPRRGRRRADPPERRQRRHRARRAPRPSRSTCPSRPARPSTSSGCSRCTCPTRRSPPTWTPGLHTLYTDLAARTAGAVPGRCSSSRCRSAAACANR